MSNSRLSAWARSGELADFRLRQRNRFDLNCESLESRYLLSTTPTPATNLGQITASPSIQVLPLVTTGPTGLSPQQISSAYGVNQITFSGGKVAGNGAGQTIAIVTAYNDPNITSDLAAFDSHYGLSAPASFTVKNLGGNTTDAGWALETSLDVEWAHALAPGASILLVEGASSSLSSLFTAVSYASKQAGVSVVSMSWGTTEFWGESSYDSIFTTPAGHSGVTYVAASGDSGAWYGPMYPSVSPNVLAVGGTTLTLSGSSYSSESGWSGSTGGFSGLDSYWRFYESQPSYQNAALKAAGLSYGVRTTPDVSFNANPNSGVSVYDSVSYSGQSGWFQVGGTSAATPAWAGLIAIADQGLATGGKGPLSGTQAQSQLYALPSSDFHDISTGYNGYSATSGYDLVTGLGSPKANLLVAGLLSANGVSETSITPHGVAATATASQTRGSRFDQTVSTTTGSGRQTNLGAPGTSASVLTSGLAASSQGDGTLAIQALSTQVSTVPTQAESQHAATTKLVSQSTAPISLPGQSLLKESDALSQRTSIDDQAEPAVLVDSTATVQSTTVQEEAPAPLREEAPAPEPALPMGFPSDSPPVIPEEPEDDSAADPFDLALMQVSVGMAARDLEVSTASSAEPAKTPAERSGLSAASLAGTAVLVAGGYRLLLGRSDRIRRRWSPGRFR